MIFLFLLMWLLNILLLRVSWDVFCFQPLLHFIMLLRSNLLLLFHKAYYFGLLSFLPYKWTLSTIPGYIWNYFILALPFYGFVLCLSFIIELEVAFDFNLKYTERNRSKCLKQRKQFIQNSTVQKKIKCKFHYIHTIIQCQW